MNVYSSEICNYSSHFVRNLTLTLLQKCIENKYRVRTSSPSVWLILLQIHTALPTKSGSDAVFCLQLLNKTVTFSLYLS